MAVSYPFNEQMFFVAYQRIYAKQDNMTARTASKTIDEMSLQGIESLITSLRNETYHPNPAKRVYISKKDGKKRPLGIPSFEDKLVQEVVRMIFEAIYEKFFEQHHITSDLVRAATPHCLTFRKPS